MVETFTLSAGADPGFEVRERTLKKSRRAERGAKIFGVFRVKNHDFTQKNHIFSNFRGPALVLYDVQGSEKVSRNGRSYAFRPNDLELTEHSEQG